MTYFLAMKRTFLSDFIRLDKGIQKRVIHSVSEIEKNPGEQRGDTVKKLIHHDQLWRYRIGNFRLVYAFYPKREVVQLLGIAPRGDVYERFNYFPDEPTHQEYSSLIDQALNPDEETPSEWINYLQFYTGKNITDDRSQSLPYLLSKKQLAEWFIPEIYHKKLSDCKTEDQLLNCDVPQSVIFDLMNLMYPSNMEKVVQEPNYILGNPSDLEKFSEGTLKDFLLLLDLDQEKFVDFGLKGPTLVKGGPGSGKSTVALYRVKKLVEQSLARNEVPRILFTTYTNTLVEFSRQLLDRLLHDLPVDLSVSTIDRLAMQIVTMIEGKPQMAEKSDETHALAGAIFHFKSIADLEDDKNFVERIINQIPEEYLWEEINWVLDGMMIPNLAAYLRLDRSGRIHKFDQRTRITIWRIYEYINNYLINIGKVSWGGLRKKALKMVHSGQWEALGNQKYDYVLIDEAQDITPAALSLCIELCEDPSGLFLTADASQSLYNRGFAWKNVHQSLKIAGRTRILKRNYRTTHQIAEASETIVKPYGAGDDEVLSQTYIHVGRKPTIYIAQEEKDMLIWIAESILKASRELHLPLGSTAVLSPTNDIAREVANKLTLFGLDTKYMTSKDLDLDSPKVKSLTIHSSKGLEFPIVVIPFVEDSILPRRIPVTNKNGIEQHLNHERRIFYVGCTRAMRSLFITGREKSLSPFLNNLDGKLWNLEIKKQ